jgi:membrane protease subunit HflC
MKKLITVLVFLGIFLASLLIANPLYILDEGEQAVVVRLGQIVAAKSDAGLHFRSPFHRFGGEVSETHHVLGRRAPAHPYEGKPVHLGGHHRPLRIADPAKFYESVTTLEGAYGRLGDVIDSAVRTVIADNWLRETVRNSNIINERKPAETFEVGSEADAGQLTAFTQTVASFDSVQKGRRKLAEEMLALSRKLVPEYGIELIDVVPRQIKYSDELTESVYNRMIKERSQIAQAFRSHGEGKKAEWLGKQENEQRTSFPQPTRRRRRSKEPRTQRLPGSTPRLTAGTRNSSIFGAAWSPTGRPCQNSRKPCPRIWTTSSTSIHPAEGDDG